MPSALPPTRPLGAVALGSAALSAVLSPTYLLSPFAFPAAALALVLGLVARTDDGSRSLGTAAVLLAVLALAVASAVLVWS